MTTGKALPSSDMSGRWVEAPISYVDPTRISCDLCGRPIARRYWQERIDGAMHSFCEQSHAELFVTYWLPTWGQDSSESESDRSVMDQPGERTPAAGQ